MKYQFGCHCIVLSFFDLWLLIATLVSSNLVLGARRGRNRMVVGFTTTYAISAYHHWCCEFESRSGRGVQHYVIKFVSDLRQVGSRFSPVSSTNKTDRHDITEILLKVVLNQYPAMARRKETEINAKYDLKVGNHQTNKQTNKHKSNLVCSDYFQILFRIYFYFAKISIFKLYIAVL